MNARELLAAAADWLGWQEEDLSFGLKSAEDGIRLYAYAMAHPELPEMADSWTSKERRKALGYEPMGRWQPGQPDAAIINADDGLLKASKAAFKLLDSVAFVSNEGDTKKPLALLRAGIAQAEGGAA